MYDTDHTDLNSDFDEAELRRELLKDVSTATPHSTLAATYRTRLILLISLLQKWRQLFDQFDPEGFGEIPVDDFLAALKSTELQSQVPLNKIELLYHRALKSKEPNGSGSVSFQEFVNVVSEPEPRIITIVCT